VEAAIAYDAACCTVEDIRKLLASGADKQIE
jgi:hypothetical protein